MLLVNRIVKVSASAFLCLLAPILLNSSIAAIVAKLCYPSLFALNGWFRKPALIALPAAGLVMLAVYGALTLVDGRRDARAVAFLWARGLAARADLGWAEEYGVNVVFVSKVEMNPYVSLLAEGMERAGEGACCTVVRDLAPRWLWQKRHEIDVLHLHWAELLFASSASPLTARGVGGCALSPVY